MRTRRDDASVAMAAAMTREASRQSYLTIRWLADRAYRADAYALYAWFRWLDDTVDEGLSDRDERLAFVARERDLLARAADGVTSADLAAFGITPQESLLVGLARPDGPLRSLGSMLDVMEFDARRRGSAVTADELDGYTRDLAVAVTEALHHCIGHGCGCPQDETRWVAVSGAHVAHMLRDLVEDVAAGYLNLPAELLPAELLPARLLPSDARPADLSLEHLHTPKVRAWVRDRVELARSCFATGRTYLARVENPRCRLAGHAYVARFEWVLEAIEGDGYRLRGSYPERATARGGLTIAADGARSAFAARRTRRQHAQPGGAGTDTVTATREVTR